MADTSVVSKSPRGPSCGRLILAIVLLVVWCTAGQADQSGQEDVPAGGDARAVFERLRLAWETEDQQGLADLVHPDGLRIHGTTSTNRFANYSPSQSYYYFKNLFQIHDTDAFIFHRVQETEDTPRVHAMAQWHRHRTGSSVEDVLRLMIVLTRDGDRWALAEINIIR